MDKQQKGTDHKLSLEPIELRQLIEQIRCIEDNLSIAIATRMHDNQAILSFLSSILNDHEIDDVKLALLPVHKKCILNCEMACRMKLGKSLVYRHHFLCGQKITENDICAKVNEPFGISAERYDEFVGKILQNDVDADENLYEKHFQ